MTVVENSGSDGDLPLVTVVIPAFNAEATIARAIESALDQDYVPLEIIVIDDGSVDGTAGIVRRYAARGVRLIPMKENRGASACRNEGIRAASGRYVAFLDADDEWLPEKTRRQVALFGQYPDLTLVCCDGLWISADGGAITTVFAGIDVPEVGTVWKRLLRETFVSTPCVMAPRDRLLSLGGFDTSLIVAEDWDLWIRLALRGPVGAVHEPLVRIHWSPDSLMKREAQNARFHRLPMVAKHLRAQRARLTAGERRQIWSAQLERVGRQTCRRGNWIAGMMLLLRAMALGCASMYNMKVMISTCPLVRRLGRR